MVENINSSGKSKMYKPNIKYEYIINGKKYWNDGDNNMLYYKNHYRENSMAQNYLINYTVGGSINIIYDKDNPENSIIKNQLYEMRFFINILSLAFSFIGIIGLFFIIKHGKLK